MIGFYGRFRLYAFCLLVPSPGDLFIYLKRWRDSSFENSREGRLKEYFKISNWDICSIFKVLLGNSSTWLLHYRNGNVLFGCLDKFGNYRRSVWCSQSVVQYSNHLLKERLRMTRTENFGGEDEKTLVTLYSERSLRS